MLPGNRAALPAPGHRWAAGCQWECLGNQAHPEVVKPTRAVERATPGLGTGDQGGRLRTGSGAAIPPRHPPKGPKRRSTQAIPVTGPCAPARPSSRSRTVRRIDDAVAVGVELASPCKLGVHPDHAKERCCTGSTPARPTCASSISQTQGIRPCCGCGTGASVAIGRWAAVS